MLSATHFEIDLRAIEITITYGVAMNSLFGWWWLGGEGGGGARIQWVNDFFVSKCMTLIYIRFFCWLEQSFQFHKMLLSNFDCSVDAVRTAIRV